MMNKGSHYDWKCDRPNEIDIQVKFPDGTVRAGVAFVRERMVVMIDGHRFSVDDERLQEELLVRPLPKKLPS